MRISAHGACHVRSIDEDARLAAVGEAHHAFCRGQPERKALDLLCVVED